MRTRLGRKLKFTVISLSLLLFLALAAQATEYFASPGGSGTTCSSGTPCSLDTCIDTASSPNDICTLKDGTYSDDLLTAHGGTLGNPIIIRGENFSSKSSWSAIISKSSGNIAGICHSYVTIQGIDFNMGNTGGGSGGIRFNPNTSGGTPNCGTASPRPPIVGVTFRDNRVRNAGRSCMHLGNGDLEDSFIFDNVIAGCGYAEYWGEAFYFGSITDSTAPIVNVKVYGNDISDFTEECFDIRNYTDGNEFYNNVCRDQVTSQDHSVTPPASRGNSSTVKLGGRNNNFHNNVFHNNKAGDFAHATVMVDSANKFHHNLIFDGVAVDGKNNDAVRMDTFAAWANGTVSEVYNNTFYNMPNTDCQNCSTYASTSDVYDNIGVNFTGNTTTSSATWFEDPDNATLASVDFNLKSGAPPRGAGAGGTHMGAYQYEPVLSQCEAIDASSIIGRFTNDHAPPISATDYLKYAVNCTTGGDQTESSSTVSATNETDTTLSASTCVGGDTITLSLSYGAVEDSACLGDTDLVCLNGKNPASGSPLTCTNSIGGAPAYAITQVGWRWIKSDSTDPVQGTDYFGESNRALNTDITAAPGAKLIYAVAFETDASGDAPTQGYKIRRSTTKTGTFTDLAAQGACGGGTNSCASAHASAGGTTAVVIDPDAGLTDVACKLVDTPNAVPNITLTASDQTECRYSIQIADDASVGSQECFRVEADDNTAFGSYGASGANVGCVTVRSRRAYGF